MPAGHAESLWNALAAAGCQAVRARRARHAAPRSRHEPLRPGHGRERDAARVGPCVDRRPGEPARFRRQGGACRAPAAVAARGTAARSKAAASCARTRACTRRAATARPRAARSVPRSASRSRSRACRRASRPATRSRCRCATSRSRPGSSSRRSCATARYLVNIRRPANVNVPKDLKYADSHEWMRAEADGTVTIGITDHAQEALGDLVFIELPAVGRKLAAGEACAVVESVKAASDVYAPHRRRSRRGERRRRHRAGIAQRGRVCGVAVPHQARRSRRARRRDARRARPTRKLDRMTKRSSTLDALEDARRVRGAPHRHDARATRRRCCAELRLRVARRADGRDRAAGDPRDRRRSRCRRR